ncbi:MAG: DegV family EDD domain-containing protein [Ruminococcaceae bacterium]|nr:DegV family EDD domain-containing protein [Oscillospiraceae bacterium]
MPTYRIVADSSADLTTVDSIDPIPFRSAPLKIITAEKEYVDDAQLDTLELVTDLLHYKGRSSTSCPSVGDWLESFGNADEVFCVTITATLSGSYNAAMLAKNEYEEAHPDRRVFVLNSLSTGPEMALIIEKIRDLILAGNDFETICAETTKYSQRTGLLFMLESMQNLANNGRVSPLVAKMAGFLGIRVVGKASDHGDLEQLNKCRGEAKALDAIVGHMKALGLKMGKVRITHCFNESAALALKALLLQQLEKVRVEISQCRGLCSFYAEKGGMLIGFEKQ